MIQRQIVTGSTLHFYSLKKEGTLKRTQLTRSARWYKKHITLSLAYIFQGNVSELSAFSLSFSQTYPTVLQEAYIQDLLIIPGMIEREARYILEERDTIVCSMTKLANVDLGILPELLAKKRQPFIERCDLFRFYANLGIQNATVFNAYRMQPDMLTAMFITLPNRRMFRFISIDEGIVIAEIMKKWLMSP